MNTKLKAFQILLEYYKITPKETPFETVIKYAHLYLDGIIGNCCDVDNIGYWSSVRKELRYFNKQMFLEMVNRESDYEN